MTVGTAVPYRITVLLLWAQAVAGALTCRSLFWDGASFLANMLESGGFHDFYPSRAHVAWLTETPTLLLARAGVRDVHLLAIVFSATLFAIPAALYHLALARLRRNGTLLAAMIAAVGTVYLPTSFFNIGEHNITYALVAATFAIALTRRDGARDGALMLAFGLVAIASYEVMIYLGPIAAAVVLWSQRGQRDPAGRMLSFMAALAFAGASLVSINSAHQYWNHPHFVLVREATLDFWQNMQFVIPLAALAMIGMVGLVYPTWLRSRGTLLPAALMAVLLVVSPWVREVRPETFLFPPSHYVARTAAGGLLALLMLLSWAHVALPKRLRLLAVLHEPVAGRRLATAMLLLVLGGAIPEIWLTRQWVGYLAWFRGVVTSQTGIVSARDLPLDRWPYRLFAQDWTYPALSVLLRNAPGQAVVVAPNDYLDDRPFDPLCGTVPRLDGYAWR
ncbi:MAG: hypothetical protein JSS04_10225 [Proteobacteria bacterium]|nr:hypothetical protein [Pseudomonadota bacterium]